MELLVDACFFIFTVTAICSGVTTSRVTITPNSSELVVQEGDKFEITCKGEGRLQFSRQMIADSVEFYDTIKAFGMYKFETEDATREHTGWYVCAEEGVTIKITPETVGHLDGNIRAIYVYVNSSEPFVDMDAFYQAIDLVSDETAVIPCRVTSPKLQAILWHADEEQSVPSDGNVSYDPKFGFIWKHIHLAVDNNAFCCKIDEENPCGFTYKLFVTPGDPLPKKDMKTEPVADAVPGTNLTLPCEITVVKGMRVTLRWETPPFIPKNRLVSSNPSETGNENITHAKSLTILNIKYSDAGEYICVAKGAIDEAKSSTNVSVTDPNHPYLTYKVKGNLTVIDAEHEDAVWHISVKSFPPASFKWYKDGREIVYVESDGDHKGKYLYVPQKSTWDIFKISDLNLHDTGNYTIEITTSINSSVIPLQVVVNAKPVVRIHSNTTYYKPGKSAVFSCNTTGFPKPNVTWSFSEGLSNENYTESVTLVSGSEPREVGEFSVIYDLKMPVNTMGHLICTSCNEMNCTETSERVFVSDGNGLFGIDCNPPVVVEGDNITLKCVASHYNYTETIGWKLKNSMKLVLVPERMTVEHNSTEFTSRSILRITNVSQTDAGIYSCEAKSKAGNFSMTNYTLTVKKSAGPSVNKIILHESQAHVNLNKEKYPIRTLNCRALGMPPPIVTWFKDGKDIRKHPDLNYTLSSDNSSLEIGPLSQENAGNYSCVAMNRLDRIERWVNIEVQGKTDNTGLWIGLVCALIVIIVIVITYMGIKVHRERVLRKELFDAGLTHFEEGALECLNPDLTVDEQAELLPYDKKWEFPRELLKLGRQLGSGAFGVVMKAEARGICVEGETTTVAVKMVRRSADPSYMKALSSELKIMIHLGRHLNVVNLLGACTKTILSKRELYVIVEYCQFGNLHNYLQRHRANFINQIDPTTQKIDTNIGMERLARSDSVGSQNKSVQRSFSRTFSITSDSSSSSELVHYRQGQDYGDISMSPDGGVLSNNSVQPGWRSNYRGDYKDQNLKPICTQDLLCWAWQVSSGMKYLSDRKVLHGDLAARNILLAEDNIVKICDFGLAKNMYKDNNYQKKGEGPLPIKWMAIESIRDRIFSTQSDVWSFGIVLWEFFTLARTPYPGMEAETQYDKLIGGYRMEKPEFATDEIYDIMLQCWRAKPTLRPLFPELTETLGALLNDGVRLHYLDLNTPYMDMNITSLKNGQNDYLTMMSSPDHDYYNGPDPGTEVPSDTTNYLPMSPVVKTEGSCIFSPRAGLAEVQFEFPLPEGNTPNSSGVAGSGSKDIAMPEAGSPEKNPGQLQQDKVSLIDLHVESTPGTGESGYSTDTNNPMSGNRTNQSSKDCLDDLYNHPKDLKFLKNNTTELLSLPTIQAGNNYINMPKPKIIQIEDPTDAFSNPSYVLMSKPQETR